MGEGGSGAGAARKPIAFISHHNSQEKIARHLKSIFERNGVTGWMAPDDIEPGLPFDRAIIEQVRKSDIIVLLFCAQSDQSKHVKRELMLAEDHDKLIYPVRLEAIEPTGLAYWLQDYQWIDWVDRRDATIERMLATVKRQVAARDAARSAAAEEEAAETAVAEEDAASSPATAESEPPPAPPSSRPTPAPPDKTAQAFAGPPMKVPMPLVGRANEPSAAAENDDASAPPGGGFAARIGRNGWIAIGVIGALLILLVGVALFAGAAPDDEDDEDNRLLGGGSRGERGSPLEPGMWASRYEDIVVVFPELEESIARQYTGALATAIASRACVGAAEARDPGIRFFDPDGVGNCEIDELDMADGEITAEIACRPNGGVEEAYSLRGRYTDTEIEGNMVIASGRGTPGYFLYRGRWTIERTGDCE